jgi:hypothetical protein
MSTIINHSYINTIVSLLLLLLMVTTITFHALLPKNKQGGKSKILGHKMLCFLVSGMFTVKKERKNE